ncbi:hypothetical protein GALL_468280 [mine drainage metagenome]|uniref:Uncharacterized protein n=1 Tax=mine drainage metagenome TaxID=410659 RepID=A0A1J5PK61_9ZZZZ
MTLAVAIDRVQVRNLLAIALSILALSVPLSAVKIGSFGSSQTVVPWLGSLTLSVTVALLCAGVFTASGFAGQLTTKGFGREHAGTAVMAVVLSLSAIAMTIWLVGPGAQSANRAGRVSIVPAFIDAASKGSDRPRTLVLAGGINKSRYTIFRDRPLQLGDAEVEGATIPSLDATVAAMVSGGTQTTSVELGQYAIRYVFLAAPLDRALVRNLDGVSGLSRVSATTSGVLWKVAGITSRVRFIAPDGTTTSLPSDRVGAEVRVVGRGRIVIADRGDPGWRAFENGVQLTRSYAYGWATSFGVTKPGSVLIVHDSTKRRTGISLQFLAALALLVFILPGGRRKIDRTDEEVA